MAPLLQRAAITNST